MGDMREGEATAEPHAHASMGSGTREANFAADFVAAITAVIGGVPNPRVLIDYLYAVAHSRAYRALYAEELRRGFPRIPLPTDWEAFRRFSELGSQLVSLHVGAPGGSYPNGTLSPAAADSETSGAFRIGGYDVLKRWARPRRTRGLSADDERELARIAWIGRETQRLMHEIDRQSPDHRWGVGLAKAGLASTPLGNANPTCRRADHHS